jgi:hypothetical protein
MRLNPMNKQFLLLVLAGVSPVLRAASAPAAEITDARAKTAPVFTLYFENDFFGGTDRHYTNGAKLSWISGDLTGWGQDGWRKSFLEALPFINRPDTQKNFGLALGQNIYTPQDKERANPDPTDRPYAGWSYLEFSFLSKSERHLDVLAVQLGIVSPHSYAGDVQSTVHAWINNSIPNGWDYQLHDEPGVNVVYEHRWRAFGRAFGNALGVDFVPHLGASLGNVQTYANAGATARIGYNLPSDFGVDLIRGAGVVNTPIDDHDPRLAHRTACSIFVFGGVDGRAVARDVFLDGNTFRDSRSVPKEDFVADLDYGVGMVFGRWQLTYTNVIRTREFKGQDRANRFGSITLSRAF